MTPTDIPPAPDAAVSEPDRVAEPLGATGYLAPEGFVDALVTELQDLGGGAIEVRGRLVFAPGPPRPVAWVANIWYDPVRIPVASIKAGARALRAIQRSWTLFPTARPGRARLIQELLPHVSARPLTFPEPPPESPLGSWTLTDDTTIIAAARCSSPFPNGVAAFVEDRQTPPNRAYLKLWEALTAIGQRPGPGDRCLDLGASPGGWSWVLHELGADVVSVDKAPLAPAIARLPRIDYRGASAFGLDPRAIGPVDWLFSDIVCYPARLLRLVETWRASGLARRFVCTIKFQGETDHAAARAFAAIPGSHLFHLHHNKHELTWVNIG